MRKTVDDTETRLIRGPAKLAEGETVACVSNFLSAGQGLVDRDADVDVGAVLQGEMGCCGYDRTDWDVDVF
jgi:hypothetical protein